MQRLSREATFRRVNKILSQGRAAGAVCKCADACTDTPNRDLQRMNTVVLVIAGLAGLVIGGEMLVRGAVSAARAFNVPPMVIGLTLVGFGTSTPELVTSLQAALSGSPGVALGNVIGSNIGNILLILGFTALLAPVAVDPKAFRRDGLVMIIATLMCLGVVLV